PVARENAGILRPFDSLRSLRTQNDSSHHRWLTVLWMPALAARSAGGRLGIFAHADAAAILVLFGKSADEDVEDLVALAVEKLLSGLVKVLRRILGRRLLLVGDSQEDLG